MGIAVLIVLCIICAAGWLKWKIATLSITYYLIRKGYTPPSKTEIEECTQYAIRHLGGKITGNGI